MLPTAAQGPNIPQDLHDQAIAVANQAISIANARLIGTTTMSSVAMSGGAWGWYPLANAPSVTQGINLDYLALNNAVEYTNGVATTIVNGADISTFEIGYDPVLSGRQANAYGKDAAHIYYTDRLIPEADASTFTPYITGKTLSQYAFDDHHVYCQGILIPGADPATFLPVNYGSAAFGGGPSSFGEDISHVYECTYIVPKADPQTFAVVTNVINGGVYASPYSKDKNNVYFNTAVVPYADPATFQLDNDDLGIDARDKNYYYSNGGIVPAPNATSTPILDSNGVPTDFAYAGSEMFYKSQYFSSDPKTFQIIYSSSTAEQMYAKDASSVYYDPGSGSMTTIVGADPKTFQIVYVNPVTTDLYAKDKNHAYYDPGTGIITTIVAADPGSFSALPGETECSPDPTGDCYYDAQDKNHLYDGGVIVR